MIARYKALLAFHKAYKRCTQIAQAPLPTVRTLGSEALLARKPTALLKRVSFAADLPTIDEDSRMLQGLPAVAVRKLRAMESSPHNIEDQAASWATPPLRADPTVIMTWNSNGVGPLLKKTACLRDLNATLQQRNVDVLFIQEVKLRAHESGDQCRVCEKDESLLAAFLLHFPEYHCILSLDLKRKYAGQMLLYHRALKRPAMSFNYGAEPLVHHPEGRVMIAEFAHVKCVGVYVPCISDLDSARLARRRDFDKRTKNYLSMAAATSVKPVVFCGDMNAVEDLGQTTHDKAYWQSLVQNKHFNVPANSDDHQWAGTSDPEIKRFSDIRREGRLINPAKR